LEAILRRADPPKGLFNLERILVSTEEFFALHRGIVEASNDPALGLRLGTEERIERYDPRLVPIYALTGEVDNRLFYAALFPSEVIEPSV
jgi:hypothetical protein